MFKKALFVLLIHCSLCASMSAQSVADTTVIHSDQTSNPKTVEPKQLAHMSKTDKGPVISYETPQTCEIADIKISGMSNPVYEDYALIGFSGLSVGDKIQVPGTEITNAIKRFWKQGLFSEVTIFATKIENGKVWLDIKLKDRPRISNITFSGIKKSEQQDLDLKIGLIKGNQITINQEDRAKILIKKYYDEKGYNNALITITQTPDAGKKNYVDVNVDVKKNNKTYVHNIIITGNKEVDANTLAASMKKTRDKFSFKAKIRNFLRSTKYVPEDYEADKTNLITKYNELGYRDAAILSDSVTKVEGDKVDISMKVYEGKRYYIRSIDWVGNTEYSTDELQFRLRMKAGDVYDQKKLNERLLGDDDAVNNECYYNRGYIFSTLDPVETNVENDSIDLQIRVNEGRQATIRKVGISGNDRLYEDIVRRELRTKPGELFSRDALMRSLREIAQTGHFDPESLAPDVQPNPETGTVDINYPLVTKGSDQVEFSAGWGATGVVGKLSLKFTNFSLRNLFNPSMSRGIIPQGEGQTLTLSGQTNGRYYQSYSMSFIDPWFGGKRPNTLSVGAYYAVQTGYNNNYYNNTYNNNYYNQGAGLNTAIDTNQYMKMLGASVGYGKRLSWPDDYFYAQAELAYQRYNMRNWDIFMVRNGVCNNISLKLTLSRNSTDNPLYTRRGMDMSASVELTPPFSSWDGKDYAAMTKDADGFEPASKYTWIEYHKWKFKSKTYLSLIPSIKKTPVLMTRAECGIVGSYSKYKKSPFGTFYVGGDGMSGYSSTYATETVGLRGYANGSLGYNESAYTRLAFELRYPLILEPSSTIYLLTFAEAGNAWTDVKDFNPFDLKRSAGVGVRIMLPMIGLMGIDWGYGFDPINGSRSQSGSQFHFIIGQEF